VRRRPREHAFPPSLATFTPTDWPEADGPALRPVHELIRRWSRWLDARGVYLLRLGYREASALELAYADLPADLVISASKSPAGPPQSGAVGSQGRGAALHLPPQ